MRVITELIATIQNTLNSSHSGYDFDGRKVVNAYQKGKNKLVLELGDDAEIIVKFKANGKKTTCPVCRKAKVGWPNWWRNVAKSLTGDGRKAVRYACHDCVVDSRGDAGGSEAGGPEQDLNRH